MKRTQYVTVGVALGIGLSGPGPASLDAALLSDDEVARPGSAAASVVRPAFGDEGASVPDRRRVSGR